MKTRIVFLFAVFNFFLINRLLGQAPERLSYQAVIKDSFGNLVSNRKVGVKISFLNGSESGAVDYSETHIVKTNVNGLMTLEIGGGVSVKGEFGNIDWAGVQYFLKREIDPLGGNNYVISGMSQILSVPYLIHANIADTVLNVPDPSSINEIQELSVSPIGDTLFLSQSNYVVISGISNYNPPIITDIDGNSYRTVWIKDELWFAENLRSSNYNDGTPIPNVIDSIEWGELATGARSYYDNDSSKYDTIYGALYNFFAVATSKLCPTGWHVPTDEEWVDLTDYLGGENVAGGKLKDKGTVHWDTPNEGATDTVGFTALPGGRRTLTGTFDDSARKIGAWWSSTPDNSIESWYRLLDYNFAIVFEPYVDTRFGFSVRCLKD
jgi:uncharacterized protein (TIGR02145 family)